MNIEECKTSLCVPGYILAEDIFSNSGLLIVAHNTIINEYIKNKLMNLGISTVRVLAPVYNKSVLKSEDLMHSINMVKKNYRDNVYDIKEVITELAAGRNLNIEKVNTITETLYSKVYSNFSMVECLNEVRDTDEYTYSHCINVSLYALLIGRWLNLPEKKLKELVHAGILHDIGKSKIPSEILNKKCSLSLEEFEVIKKHPIYGYNIVKQIQDISTDVKKVVLMHHEKEDGSGYPIGVFGDKINLYTKIISIADVYDALTSERAYKPRLTPFDTFREFEKIGYGSNCFDLKILIAFISNISSYYTGSMVKLKSGKIGEIVYVPPHSISNPIVKVNSEYIDLGFVNEEKIVEML